MRVIKPITVTDTVLATASIPEPDASAGEVLWNPATAYAAGAEVVRTTTHRVYRRLVAGTTATAPEADPTNWKPIRPTNRWGAFDESVGTLSEEQAVGPTQIVYELSPGVAVNSIALFEVSAQEVEIEVFDAPGGALVYSNLIDLDETFLNDWYGYFFEPFALRSAVIDSNLPPFAVGRIRITVRGETRVACGNIVIGNVYSLGSTAYGLTAGIRDYSRKIEDEETGIVTLERRRFAKVLRARFQLPESAVNFVHQLLSELRSTPVVWIGDNGAGLEPLIIYGFYRDFSLELETARISYYALEVEGMA